MFARVNFAHYAKINACAKHLCCIIIIITCRSTSLTIMSGVFQLMGLVLECPAVVAGEELQAWQHTTKPGFLLSGAISSTKCSNQVILN